MPASARSPAATGAIIQLDSRGRKIRNRKLSLTATHIDSQLSDKAATGGIPVEAWEGGDTTVRRLHDKITEHGVYLGERKKVGCTCPRETMPTCPRYELLVLGTVVLLFRVRTTLFRNARSLSSLSRLASSLCPSSGCVGGTWQQIMNGDQPHRISDVPAYVHHPTYSCASQLQLVP